MPPEGNTQFDLHMHESMHRLHELRSNFKTDIFVSVCCSNIPKAGQTDKQVDPKDIVKRIRKKGYNWWDIVRLLDFQTRSEESYLKIESITVGCVPPACAERMCFNSHQLSGPGVIKFELATRWSYRGPISRGGWEAVQWGPMHHGQNDRHLQKHYLPTTLLAGSN